MPTEDELLQEIEGAFGVGAMAPGEPAVCFALRREVRLQYRFMAMYQWIVLALSVVTLGLLIAAAWSAYQGLPIAALLESAGAIVSGVASKFLLDQRKDAQKTHKAALAGLAKHKCKSDV